MLCLYVGNGENTGRLSLHSLAAAFDYVSRRVFSRLLPCLTLFSEIYLPTQKFEKISEMRVSVGFSVVISAREARA